MLGMSSMGPSLALALPNPSPARPSCESGLEFRWWNTCDWVKVLSPAEGAGDHAQLHRREATKGPTPDYWGGADVSIRLFSLLWFEFPVPAGKTVAGSEQSWDILAKGSFLF